MEKHIQDKIDYTVIVRAIQILTDLCAGNEEKTIDLITGYLWDEEEAGKIKLVLRDLTPKE